MLKSNISYSCFLLKIFTIFTVCVVYQLVPIKRSVSIRIGRPLFTSETSEVAKLRGYYAINSGTAQMCATTKSISLSGSFVSLLATWPALQAAWHVQYCLFTLNLIRRIVWELSSLYELLSNIDVDERQMQHEWMIL